MIRRLFYLIMAHKRDNKGLYVQRPKQRPKRRRVTTTYADVLRGLLRIKGFECDSEMFNFSASKVERLLNPSKPCDFFALVSKTNGKRHVAKCRVITQPDIQPAQGNIADKLGRNEQHVLRQIKDLKIEGCQRLCDCWVHKVSNVSSILFTVTEYASKDLLQHVLSEECQISDKLCIVMQMVENVMSLHKHGYAHGDLSLEQFCYDRRNDKVTLIDFEFSNKIDTPHEHVKILQGGGKSTHIAPEYYKKNPLISAAGDIYALATTIFNFVFHPFTVTLNGVTEHEALRKILKGMLHPDPKKRSTLPHVKAKLVKLISAQKAGTNVTEGTPCAPTPA